MSAHGPGKGGPAPRPVEVRLRRAQARLVITFSDGACFSYPAEYLRVETPSAEARGHGAARSRREAAYMVHGKRGVGLIGIAPVGRYALRITFDDGHDTGLFSWALLHELGCEQRQRWRDYLRALRRAGLTRRQGGASGQGPVRCPPPPGPAGA